MELQEAVRSRRSIRRFLSKPVPEVIVNEVISEALWAPSWGNTQPWKIQAITGELLERFKAENTEAFLSGESQTPEIPIPSPETWPDAMVRRYNEIGRRVLDSLSISREDHGSRIEYYARMYALFDAPVLIMITLNEAVPVAYGMLDVGHFLQTFCLLARDRGLGTCILGSAVLYPKILRRLFDLAEDHKIAIGAALGWPDPEAPVNHFTRSRGALEEFVQWIR
jgi:nitroreductase